MIVLYVVATIGHNTSFSGCLVFSADWIDWFDERVGAPLPDESSTRGLIQSGVFRNTLA